MARGQNKEELMRYVAMLIVLALLATTAVGQSVLFSDDASKIRKFVEQRPLGQKLYVYMKTGPYRLGMLAKIDAETFELTFEKRVEEFAYSAVAGIAEYYSNPNVPPEKNSFWKRVGRGFEKAFAITTIGTLLVAFYPVAKLTGQFANAKAKALKKELAKTLPTGTSKSQVIVFLASRKIEHSEGLNQIEASISRGFGYYIDLTFRFDERNRLIDSKVNVIQVDDCL